MKKDHQVITNRREEPEELDIESMLKDFQKESKDRRPKENKRRNYKR